MSQEEYPKVYLYRRIVQGKLFIDEHFGDDINLDLVADEAYFSKFHFIRLFKKAYGKTPHQYLTKVRIDCAKLLLQEGTPVSEVCYRVGFDSITSFTDLFKRVAGMAPSVFQSQQQVKKEEIARIPLKHIPNCFAEKNGWAPSTDQQ